MIISVIHDQNTYTLSVICRAFNNDDEDDEFAIENDHSKLTPTTCRLNRMHYNDLWTWKPELNKQPLGKLTRIYDAAAVAADAAAAGMPNLSVK